MSGILEVIPGVVRVPTGAAVALVSVYISLVEQYLYFQSLFRIARAKALGLKIPYRVPIQSFVQLQGVVGVFGLYVALHPIAPGELLLLFVPLLLDPTFWGLCTLPFWLLLQGSRRAFGRSKSDRG